MNWILDHQACIGSYRGLQTDAMNCFFVKTSYRKTWQYWVIRTWKKFARPLVTVCSFFGQGGQERVTLHELAQQQQVVVVVVSVDMRTPSRTTGYYTRSCNPRARYRFRVVVGRAMPTREWRCCCCCCLPMAKKAASSSSDGYDARHVNDEVWFTW